MTIIQLASIPLLHVITKILFGAYNTICRKKPLSTRGILCQKEVSTLLILGITCYSKASIENLNIIPQNYICKLSSTQKGMQIVLKITQGLSKLWNLLPSFLKELLYLYKPHGQPLHLLLHISHLRKGSYCQLIGPGNL